MVFEAILGGRLLDAGRLLEESVSHKVHPSGGGGGRLLDLRRLFGSGHLLDHLRYVWYSLALFCAYLTDNIYFAEASTVRCSSID